MKNVCYLAALALALAGRGALAQSDFEADNFNATDALFKQGIDVNTLPGFDELRKSQDSSAPLEKRGCFSCTVACDSLKLLYGSEKVLLKDKDGYSDFVGGYWSDNQAQVRPACVFKPTSGLEVSSAVLLSRVTRCPFAAKSGGHAAFAGASSIEDGVTISFANMKDVTLSADKSIASVGPGNIWGPVFEELAKSDLTVIGGRLYNIGVGGLTTGGGISYFSNTFGWAADNVESFDVVTASGLIVRASATEYPDLYKALRGGGNNLGLVVNFNLQTVPLPGGKMWGGSKVHTEDKFPEVDRAFANLIANSADDTKAGLWLVHYQQAPGVNLALTTLWHADPDGGNKPIFAEFNAIAPVSDDTKPRVLGEWGKETMAQSPPGLRETYYTLTVKADVGILEFARKTYFESVGDAVGDVPGVLPNMVTQGITIPQLEQMQKNGGNALGLRPEDGPLYIIMIASMWKNKEDDARVQTFMSDVMRKVKAEAKARKLDHPYIYMNYASQYQDAIASYGDEIKARLKSVASRYDPAGVFQLLQPGGFKLDRAPTPDAAFFSH
ncbi:hypothetical protein GGTG_09325 [Gaeumannomyces tritici R3-111a-1]|uniref:FAD-binding PCMH-type domain-containing protein n=1 Tax=Gaeumannomyces tritici (strain R3-111a-1) TaxID=644352 RepID=J3P728_GAET3|nr:hypothetical protein GGTG_09325 [Gaeumannomyces tritici R3-111a-1]EJT72459.1 hypothetical protein GGTG_09325 [Gaeumannomyces tritici R3-111a-1]